MILKETRNTPQVILSVEDSVFEISGPSFSNQITDVYQPIIQWIDSNLPIIKKDLNCVFNFNLLNSISYKFIIEIIMRLDNYVKEGKSISIKWFHSKDDDDMYSTGKDISDLFEIPFEIIQY